MASLQRIKYLKIKTISKLTQIIWWKKPCSLKNIWIIKASPCEHNKQVLVRHNWIYLLVVLSHAGILSPDACVLYTTEVWCEIIWNGELTAQGNYLDGCLELPLLALIMTFCPLGTQWARKGFICAKVFISIPLSVIVLAERVCIWHLTAVLLSTDRDALQILIIIWKYTSVSTFWMQ